MTHSSVTYSLAGALLAAALVISAPIAANAADAQPMSQQDRMKTCNAEAKTKELKGEERKTFMSSCLSGKTEAEAPKNTQQNKMKDCNAKAGAKSLSGDERKKFMSDCLKG